MLIAAQLLAAQDRGLAVQARQVTGDPSFDIGRQYAVIIGIDRYKECVITSYSIHYTKLYEYL